MTLANELSRNGKRSGLTFAPEGGSERIRKVINKMVTEDDLIRTVSTAYANGWRQVKLYFMCGLPTETDEDVLAIADLARRVIQAGREVSGRRDIRCTVSIGGFVPKPHTPFQWAAQCDAQTVHDRLRKLGAALRSDQAYGRAVGYRYHDGEPSIIEGLLSRGDRRVAKVIKAAWQEGARFDGWSEYFSFERWIRCAEQALADEPVDVGLVHHAGTRVQRGPALGSPGRRAWTATGSGRTGRTRWTRRAPRRSRTAAGPPVTTAACAPPWAPRSRPAPPGVPCCRCPWPAARRGARRRRRRRLDASPRHPAPAALRRPDTHR